MYDQTTADIERELAEVAKERDCYREALEAIDNGSWGTLLRQRYAGVKVGSMRVFSVPEDAQIRRLARAVLALHRKEPK